MGERSFFHLKKIGYFFWSKKTFVWIIKCFFSVHPIEAVPNSLFKSDFHSLIENDAYFRCQFCAKFDDCPFHKECRLSFANLSDWTILYILNIHFDPSASVGSAITLELNHICADDKRLRFLYLHVSESKIQYALSFFCTVLFK